MSGEEQAYLTIKELNDVREVHVVFQDNVSIHLHKRQSNKEHKVFRGGVLGRPDRFPQGEDVVVHHFCQKTKQKKARIFSVWLKRACEIKHLEMAEFPITSFEVKQKPAIAEVEVSVVSILLHQLKQLRVQNLTVWRESFHHDRYSCICAHTVRVLTWIRERMLAK